MQDQGWHLDKRVPISIIAVLVAQFAAGVWMVANMNGTIQRNTADITRLERSLETMATASQIQAVQLGRIEEQVGGLRGDIQRLLNRLETSP
jgi:TolA-binding protein